MARAALGIGTGGHGPATLSKQGLATAAGRALPRQMLPRPGAVTHCLQAEYQAWGYPFDYIKPSLFPEAMAKLYAGPASAIPGTGPAPLLMRAEDWKRVRRWGGRALGAACRWLLCSAAVRATLRCCPPSPLLSCTRSRQTGSS